VSLNLALAIISFDVCRTCLARLFEKTERHFSLENHIPAEGGKEFPVLHQILQLPQLFSSSHWRQKLLIHSRHASVYPILPMLPRNFFTAASDRMKKVDIYYSSSSFHSLEKVFTCTNALGGQHARDTASHRRQTWNLQNQYINHTFGAKVSRTKLFGFCS
jgi:hypothetical protein